MNSDENEIAELKELVRQAVALGEENNTLLRKMRKSARWATILHVIYWLIIIGLSVGAFYFLEPYVTAIESVWTKSGIMSASGNAGGNSSASSSQLESQNFENVLKNL